MPNPTATPSKPPMSGGKKILFGCLGCFGLAAILVIVGVVLFFHWLNETTTPVPAEALLGPDTVEIVVVQPDADDKGVVEFVRSLGQQIDKDHPGAIDPKLREGMKRLKKNDASEIFLAFLPMTYAKVSTSGPLKDASGAVEFFSFSHYANPIRRVGAKAAEEASSSSTPSGDATVWSHAKGDKTEAIVFDANHVLRGDDPKTVGDALDRVRAWKGTSAATGLVKELRDHLAARPDVWGLLVNEGEAASREFEFLEGLPVSSAEVIGIAWELDVQGSDKATGRFHLKCRDKAVANALGRALVDRSEQVRQALKDEQEMEATFTQRVDGEWVVVDFELRDLAKRVIKAMSDGK